MCNRYRQWKTKDDLSRIFEARPLTDDPLPAEDRYPRRAAAIIRKVAGERVIDDAKTWGIPNKMKGKRPGTTVTSWVTNVRTLSSPFWRSALAKPANRCLVPFTSFAEPKPGKGEDNLPACHWFDLPASEVAAFAGIWRPYSIELKGEQLSGEAFAFLTCEPNPLVAPLHPKAMPVILAPEDYDAWLDGDVDSACALAAPFPSQLMRVA